MECFLLIKEKGISIYQCAQMKLESLNQIKRNISNENSHEQAVAVLKHALSNLDNLLNAKISKTSSKKTYSET